MAQRYLSEEPLVVRGGAKVEDKAALMHRSLLEPCDKVALRLDLKGAGWELGAPVWRVVDDVERLGEELHAPGRIAGSPSLVRAKHCGRLDGHRGWPTAHLPLPANTVVRHRRGDAAEVDHHVSALL